MSKSKKGNSNKLGKKNSEETKAKMSTAVKGKPSKRKGFKMSEEQLIKYRIARNKKVNNVIL